MPMTEEQEKAIERCEQLIKPEHANWIGISNQEAIRELLNMLKEKDKEIDLMAEQLEGVPINKNIFNFEQPNLKECITIFTNKEDVKQYFKSKAEKE